MTKWHNLEQMAEVRENIFNIKLQQLKEIHDKSNRLSYLNEFASVKINLGRRTGSSYFCEKKFKELLIKGGNPVMMVQFHRQYMSIINSLNNLSNYDDDFSSRIILNNGQNSLDSIRRIKMEYLLIQNTCFYSKSFMKTLYNDVLVHKKELKLIWEEG